MLETRVLLTALTAPGVPGPIPMPPPPANGLIGVYYDNVDFTKPKLTRVDKVVNFNWGAAAADPLLEADGYSVRWSGQLQSPTTETYTFHTHSDDGVRLWVNGQLLIDQWKDQALGAASAKIDLRADKKYDIKLEYYENAGNAHVWLGWSSPTVAKTTIPAKHLLAVQTQSDPDVPPATQPVPIAGLRAIYFDNADFTGKTVSRVDTQVNFDWGTGSPADGIDADSFSVRWLGQITPSTTGDYTFHTLSDDGVRLWVNGQLLVDNWTPHAATEDSGTISLVAGRNYQLRLEYFEQGSGATMQLSWTPPGKLKQPVAAEALGHEKFTVYDATKFSPAGVLTQYGAERIYVSGWEFWAGPYGNQDMTRGDEQATRQLARKVAGLGQVLVLDIEHWPLDIRNSSEAQVQESVQKITEIIGWIRDEAPGLKVGLYSMMPLRDYHTPVRYLTALERQNEAWWAAKLPSYEAAYRQWQAANERLRPMAERVDYIFPSLYTFYDDTAGWLKYARANIDEATRYGKPVLPFIWMEKHSNGTDVPTGELLDGMVWQTQLAAVASAADGVVIWSSSRTPWIADAQWLKGTREFLRTYNQQTYNQLQP